MTRAGRSWLRRALPTTITDLFLRLEKAPVLWRLTFRKRTPSSISPLFAPGCAWTRRRASLSSTRPTASGEPIRSQFVLETGEGVATGPAEEAHEPEVDEFAGEPMTSVEP